MAEDSARLTIELLDRSGGNTATPAPGNSANGPSIPGSDLAQQYQNQVTSQGANANIGKGSVAAPTSTPSSIPNSAPTATPTPVDIAKPVEANKGNATDVELPFDLSKPTIGLPSTPSKDPLLDIVQALVASGQKVSLEDVQGLGTRDKAHAQDLLNRALGNNQPTPTPTGTPQPTSTGSAQLPDGPLNYYFNTTPAQRDAEQMFGDTDAARAREAQTSMREAAASQRASAARREEANVQAPVTAELVPDIDPAIADLANSATRGLVRNIGSVAAGAIGGPLGSAVGIVANQAAPMIASAVASSPTLAPIAAAVLPAANVLAIPAAVTYAAVSAVNREESRAYQQIRDLDPRVAIVDAQNELRQLAADFATSRRLGDEVASFSKSKSQFEVQSQGAKDRLVEGPMDVMATYTKAIALGWKRFNDTFDKVDTMIGGSGTFNNLIYKINDWLDKQLGEADVATSFDWLDHEPHLEPGAESPFSGMIKAGAVAEGVPFRRPEFSNVPGLKF